MSAPLVSVAMPAYRAARTIGAALRSLAAQTLGDWEAIVIDDGSDDGTAAAATSVGDARVRVVSDGANRGLAARLNQAISLAQGRYLARMDADDLSFPARLATQVARLDADPAVHLLGGRALVFRGEGELVGALPFAAEHEQLVGRAWRWIPIPHPSWCGRTDWFRKHGYDPRWRRAQDQELLLRALPSSRYACVDALCVAYRQESLSPSRLARARWWHARALARRGGARYLAAAALQPAKCVADTVAWAVGYGAARHRALPVRDGDREAFAALWATASAPTGAR